MRELAKSVLLILGLLLLSSAIGSQSTSDVWKDWLEKDVRYIITSKERQIFLSLKSEKERKAFRDAFWLQRDPTPGTTINEFKDEHYRRLRYVTEYFGRGTIKEGWETDMGRVYIILGEPADKQRFYETSSNTVPIELWQYYGDTSLGLPPAFYILFYQDMSLGDYHLYSPSFDGPQRLIREYSQQTLERYDAYLQLKEISAELAEASLSLIPGTGGDPNFQSSSLSSDMLLANIQQLPEKKVKPNWAEAFAGFKEIITTDYSIDYVGSRCTLFVHQENGQNFLHAVIEPYRISMSQYEDKVYASLRLNVKISDLESHTIHQEEKTIQIEMTPQDFKKIERRLCAIGDIIPLVPGKLKINILLRNPNSKEFSSLEEKVSVPSGGDSSLSPLLFLFDEKPAADLGQISAFVFNNRKLFPNTQHLYTKDDELLFYFEIYNPRPQNAVSEIKLFVSHENTVVKEDHIPAGEQVSFLEKIPLRYFQPGYYDVLVRLTDREGKAIDEQSGEFAVSQHTAVPRPWGFSRTYPALNHPYFAMIRAYQYLGLGENDSVIREIEPFYNENIPHQEMAKLLGRAHLNKKEFSKVISILAPLKEVQDEEVLEMLGKSYFFLSDYKEAVEYLQKALAVGGEIVELINSIGISYLRLSKPEEALPYFEHSLKLNPDQAEIRETVEKIKRKDP